MEKLSVLLMIAAIVCTLFADKIDTAVKGDKKVKKVIVVFGIGVLLVCTIAIVASIVIRQIKRCLFRQIKTGLSERYTMV